MWSRQNANGSIVAYNGALFTSMFTDTQINTALIAYSWRACGQQHRLLAFSNSWISGYRYPTRQTQFT